MTISPMIEITLNGIGMRKTTLQFEPCLSYASSPLNVPTISNIDTETKVKIFVAEPNPYSSKCDGTVSIMILGAEAMMNPVATPNRNLMAFNHIKLGHISARLITMNITLPKMTRFLLPIKLIILPPKNEPRATPRIDREEIINVALSK